MINNSEKPLISQKSRCVNPTVTFKKVNKKVNGQDSKLHLKKTRRIFGFIQRCCFYCWRLVVENVKRVWTEEAGWVGKGGWEEDRGVDRQKP